MTDQRHVREEATSRILGNGALPLPVRLGLRDSLTNGWPPGTLARFELALGLSAAERSWEVWRAAFDDESPLLIARQVVAEFPHVGAELNREAARLQVVVLDSMADDASNETAIAAGLACWAVTVVAEARGYVPRQVAADTDLDMSEWEPALHASMAVSGGAPWDGRGDPALRRAFWEWYIDEACRLAKDVDTAAT